MMTSCLFVLAAMCLGQSDGSTATMTARISLGERLFHDERFSSPSGDMKASCASCHAATDPQGDRAFTEFLSKSWHPWRNEDPGRDTLRNTPTLMDVALMPSLHYDGEFASLEEQVKKTVVGRNFGWMPEERDRALGQLRRVIDGDASYDSAFVAAFGKQPEALTSEGLLASVGVAVAEFMRTLRSEHDSLYDEFMAMNDLPAAPADGETPKVYAARVMDRLATLEASGSLARPSGFEHDAYLGLKTFFRTEGDNKAGNCVTCHVPPHFTDFRFHNTGVAQEEYDSAHGSDAFAALDIPTDASTARPMRRFMSIVSEPDAARADLGRWNFVQTGAMEEGEAQALLEDSIGAFKTPTLRHLASTAPYGHNGLYGTLERAIEQKIVAAFLYRMDRLRNGDPEMGNVHISEDDIGPLFSFLNSLNNKGARVAKPTPLAGADLEGSTYYQRSPGDRRNY